VSRAALRGAEGLAVLLLGLMAGFFFAFAVDVAPALARLAAEPYLLAQQQINAVVRNAGFGGVYFGAALLPFAVAASWALHRAPLRAAAWLLLALVYGGAVFWLTRAVNVPINEAMAAWSPAAPPADWAAWRTRWNDANAVRAGVSAACFGAGLLLLGGRPRERTEV